jgi:tetratricopeptide (TPR) repeat protein
MVDWFAIAGFALSNMVAGVIGNRTDDLFCQCWQTIYERLRQGGPPVNHDLQRAIRKAILQATLCLLSDALRERSVDVQNWLSCLWLRLPFGQPRDEESRWLWRVYNELSAELSMVSSAEYVPLSPVAENELALLLRPQGVTAEKRAKELQERVTDEWLRELRELSASKQFGEPPEVFVRRLREGWQPPEATERFFWFDLVCAFFAHEIKHNQCVANIVMAKLLAGLTVDEQPLSDALTAYLERRFAPILQRLDDIKQQLDELERQQRAGFEELKERQAEIIAILLTVRETQQVMQALLSEVARLVRWVVASMAESPVAEPLDDKTRQFLREKWQQGFVGRKEAMERLNRFVATNPNGVAIVYAPAGYGKTTFLAHWIKQVEETGGWLSGDGEMFVAIVRHFFNPNIDYSLSPFNAYAYLLVQLTRLFGQPIPIRASEDERRAALQKFLANLKLPEGVKLVVVLDGLDDAEGEVKPFIPSKIPEGLFVVVSGRWDGEGELPNYLKEWAKFTEFIPLKALSEEELREWLRAAGEGELAQFAENDDFVRMLREKTDGLPLFVRYLMDDLLQAVKEGKSPEQVLERTPLGFSEYVKKQLSELEQSELIQELEQRVGSKIWDLFALLTVTKGALRQDEVEALTGFSRRELRRLPHQVTRWFSRGETLSSADLPTYSFAHPLLAEEFRKHLEEARRMEGKLLEWCADWREHPSFPYILRHYADHLYDKWQMTNEQMTYDALCRLALDPEFAQAQTKHLPDEPNLPLKTVQLALDAAIQLEDAPMMARLLMKHAKRAQIEAETPLQAWRKGHRDRALELATDIVFKRDHKLGTLWSLFLAWVAESEGERDWAKSFLDEVRKRWEGAKAKLTKLEYWQGEMAAFLLGEIEQLEGAIEVAGLVLDDESKRELTTIWASKRLFDQALKVAERIEDAEKRARALGEIVKELAKSRMFEQALKITEKIEVDWMRAGALGVIAEEMAKAEIQEVALWQQALVMAEGIRGAKERAWALEEIGEGMRKIGMTEWSEKVFEQSSKSKFEIKEDEISELLAQLGYNIEEPWEKELWDWEQGKTLIERSEMFDLQRIKEARQMAEILVVIVKEMIESGMFEQVSKMVKEIEDVWVQVWASEAITKEVARIGIFEQVLKIAAKIERVKEQVKLLKSIAEVVKEDLVQTLQIEIKETEIQTWSLRVIIEGMIRSGIFKQAIKVAKEIMEAKVQVQALSAIAEKMTKVGMEEQAKEVFDQALKVAERIGEAEDQAWALREIAEKMAEARMFEQALKVAGGIEKAWLQAGVLGVIAEKMAKVGMEERAEEIFDQALKLAEGIEEAEERAGVLRVVAGGMARAGMREWSEEVFEQALQVVEGIERTWVRAWALGAIAEEMAKAGMFEQAIKETEENEKAWVQAWTLKSVIKEMAKKGMFDQALQVVRRIKMASERVEALGTIGEEMAKVGITGRAEEVFKQALKVAEEIEDAEEHAEALRAIVEKMARVGKTEDAIGIVEQETGMRTEMLSSILPVLAERVSEGDRKSKKGFLKLLPWCGWSLEFAYQACGLLAWLYPERGEEIAGVIAATGD